MSGRILNISHIINFLMGCVLGVQRLRDGLQGAKGTEERHIGLKFKNIAFYLYIWYIYIKYPTKTAVRIFDSGNKSSHHGGIRKFSNTAAEPYQKSIL